MNDGKPAYKVLRTEDSSSYDVQRGAHRTKRVHVQMGDGTRTYVELPYDQFTPDVVHQHLEALAQTHQQVMSLQPGQPPMSNPDDTNPWG